MAETVDVPGVKKPLPKWAVFGGLGVVGLLVFQYYKNKSSQNATTSAAAAATSTDQYPADGTVGNPQDLYSTDPATGQTYGNEQAGSGGTCGAISGSGVSDQGIIGYDANGNPIYAPGYGPGASGTGTAGGPPFSSNSDWSNWVISQMQTANPNVDVGALTDALGLYLQGQPVDAAQKTLIFDAIAIGGNPPVAGANGYPPKVQTNGGTGGGTGGGGGGPVQNLHVTGRGRDYLNLGWTAQPGAGKYEVKIYDPQGHAVKSATAGSNKYRASGLHKNTRYHVFVRANNGPAGSGIYANTLK